MNCKCVVNPPNMKQARLSSMLIDAVKNSSAAEVKAISPKVCGLATDVAANQQGCQAIFSDAESRILQAAADHPQICGGGTRQVQNNGDQSGVCDNRHRQRRWENWLSHSTRRPFLVSMSYCVAPISVIPIYLPHGLSRFVLARTHRPFPPRHHMRTDDTRFASSRRNIFPLFFPDNDVPWVREKLATI